MKKKQRTIYFLRARMRRTAPMSFERALRVCVERLGRSGHIFARSAEGTSAAILDRRSLDEGLCLYIGTWVDGEGAPTVKKDVGTPQVILKTQPPPPDSEYLISDGMVLVSENNCLLMPGRIRIPLIKRYLHGLIDYSSKKELITSLMKEIELVPVVRKDLARQIHKEGVSSVHLNLTQYLETSRVRSEKATSAPLSRIVAGIGDLFAPSLTREQIVEAANLSVGLSIRLDKRFKRRGSLEPRNLAKFGEEIASELTHGEDVVIETGAGKRIKHRELALSKSVLVESSGTTISHERAWESMAEYLSELKASGALEE